jgi:hypothetical protein
MYFLISLVFFVAMVFEFYGQKVYLFRVFLTILSALIFVVLSGFNSFSPDLENYKLHYEDIDQEYMKLILEPVIFYLMTFSKNIGLTFEGYQLLLSFIAYLLFGFSLFKYSPLPVFVFLNFFFIPFFPDIVQTRFFLGFAIFLFSLQFFYNKKWLFYILLLIAILSHFTFLVFVIFLLIRRFDFFKSQCKSNIVILLCVCFLSILPKNSTEHILLMINPKYIDYDGLVTFAGTLVLFIPFFILNNVILWYHNKGFEIESIPKKYGLSIPLFIELLQFFNYMIILQYFIRDFSRVTQNGLVVASIYISIIIHSLIISKRILFAEIIVLFTIFCSVTIFITQFLIINRFEYFEVINKTVTSNRIFELFGSIL